MPLLSLFIIFIFFSCGYKTADFNKNSLNVCVDDITINSPQPTLTDILNRYILDAVIADKNKLECSYKKNVDLIIKVNSFDYSPIGYSQAQRASVYRVNINLTVYIYDKEGNLMKEQNIKETTQFFGTGLRADLERRYAVEEIARLVQMRIFNILMKL